MLPFSCLVARINRLWQIMDSVTALFRVDFAGRGELAERQQKLCAMLSKLTKVAGGPPRSCWALPGREQFAASGQHISGPFSVKTIGSGSCVQLPQIPNNNRSCICDTNQQQVGNVVRIGYGALVFGPKETDDEFN